MCIRDSTIGLAVPATMGLLPLADTRFSLAPADFQPISLACETWTALVVDPHLPIRTLPEFRQYGHDQGGKMTYASAGNGTTFHSVSYTHLDVYKRQRWCARVAGCGARKGRSTTRS